MKNTFALKSLLLLTVATAFLASRPAVGATLFTDLGPSGSVYNPNNGWIVQGSGCPLCGGSFTSANQFTLTGSGTDSISQIDLAVLNYNAPGTFQASIFTDVSGAPGAQVSGANWSSLSANGSVGVCCGLVTISGITGVNLTAGTQYFLVLAPMNLSDTSGNMFAFSNALVGDVQYSLNGGAYVDQPGSSLGAFDILGSPAVSAPTPEPSTLSLLGTGLALVGFRLRKLVQR